MSELKAPIHREIWEPFPQELLVIYAEKVLHSDFVFWTVWGGLYAHVNRLDLCWAGSSDM